MNRHGFVSPLRSRQNFGNLRRVNRRRHVAIDDLHLPPCGLVRDRRDLCLNNLATIEADSDAGPYAVIHASKYTRSLVLSGEAGMTLTVIAARLRKIAADIEALPPVNRERDIPDEMVPKLVMNAFVDDRLLAAFRTAK